MSHVSYESSNKHELSVRSNTSLSRDEARKRRRVLLGVELLENRITLSRLTLLPASLPSVAVGQNYQVADNVSPTGFTDPGFENPSKGTGGSAYQYDPKGSAWSFSGSAGLAGNGSGFTSGNPNAPQGSQVAFLQKTGTISQVVNFFPAAGSYQISVSAAQRGNFGTSNEEVQVEVDGTVVGTITPASTSYATYTTASFNVTAGSHTSTFVGVDPTGKDYTAFLDQVSIDIVSPTGDWFSRNMTDPGLQDLARWDFSRDSSLDYSDMLNLFAAAESAGSVTSAELQSLQALVTIGGAAAVNMSGSVQSLTYKVVDGDPANAQFLGAPLGNLGVGSSATQLQHLVDKWFLGMDHPTIDMQYLSGRSVNYALASGTLFGNGGPSYKDVYQGMEGDCWLLASAAETAAIEPSVIQSMFTDDGTTLEGGVQVHIWTVRFYDHGVASYLTVDNALPAGNGNFVYANLSHSISSSSNVLWVPLLEKAYAQLCESGWNARHPSNAYASLNSGGASTSLPVITGAQESSSYPFGDASSFSSAISSGTLLTVGTFSGNSSLGIVGNHDYAVLGYNASNQTFTLLNPWGWNNGAAPGILNLTWGQITQYFYLDGDCNPVSSVSLTAPAAPTFALGNQPRIRTVLAPTAGSPDSSWFTGTLLVGTGLTGPRPSGTIASERGLAAQLQALQPQVAILLDSEPMMPDSDPFELKRR
ncbi:MAG: C2 family cysteine protease [Isosphaeraceae bacterium]